MSFNVRVYIFCKNKIIFVGAFYFQGLPGVDGREGIPGMPGAKVEHHFYYFIDETITV